jgi:hypothetical protein
MTARTYIFLLCFIGHGFLANSQSDSVRLEIDVSQWQNLLDDQFSYAIYRGNEEIFQNQTGSLDSSHTTDYFNVRPGEQLTCEVSSGKHQFKFLFSIFEPIKCPTMRVSLIERKWWRRSKDHYATVKIITCNYLGESTFLKKE